MGYKSQRIEWAQPQRSVGVRGHGGEVAAGSVNYRAPVVRIHRGGFDAVEHKAKGARKSAPFPRRAMVLWK